ncbi:hypothetical protein ACFWHQ_40660 [Streptomyces sp. NPDC060334]|uniref:hypothetical protein n=1 Tax=Streptomyces sp. NPDC060334 TaxID=3347099 RepID=UPI0036584B3A
MAWGTQTFSEKTALVTRDAALCHRFGQPHFQFLPRFATDSRPYWSAAIAHYEFADSAYQRGDDGLGDYYLSTGDGYRRLALLCVTVPRLKEQDATTSRNEFEATMRPLHDLEQRVRALAVEQPRPSPPPALHEGVDPCVPYLREATTLYGQAVIAFQAGDAALGYAYEQQARAYLVLYEACTAVSPPPPAPAPNHDRP